MSSFFSSVAVKGTWASLFSVSIFSITNKVLLEKGEENTGETWIPLWANENDLLENWVFITIINYLSTNNNIDFSSYQSGARVYHKKFGEGTINYVEPEGEDLKVDINFDKVGHKRLMAKYANLEIL